MIKLRHSAGLWLGLAVGAGCGGILEVGASGEHSSAGGVGGTSDSGGGEPADGHGDGGEAADGQGDGGEPASGLGGTGASAVAGTGSASTGMAGRDGIGGGGQAGDAPVGGGGHGGEKDAPCDCATSPALTLLDCTGTNTYARNGTRVSVDASTILFARCVGDACQTMGQWSASDGTRIVEARHPVALSADGSTSLVDGPAGVYLRRTNGQETLLPFYPTGLTEDGSIAVGSSVRSDGVHEAVRWSAADGVVPTGLEAYGLMVRAVNADASALAGTYIHEESGGLRGTEPFLWSAAGTRLLGTPTWAGSVFRPDGYVTAMSDNGNIAAGEVYTARRSYSIFRYVETTGMTELGVAHVPSKEPDSGVVMSADGSVLAGTIGTPTEFVGNAFRYTEAEGVVLLSMFSRVRDMSADGSTILGNVTDENNRLTSLFVWDAIHGVRSLEGTLREAGHDLRGWGLGVYGVLAKNGKVAVGIGTCGGDPAIYRATLSE